MRDVRGLLGRTIPRTRQILGKLLVGRLECRAFDEGERVGYRFTGQGSLAELLPAEAFNSCGDPGGIRTRDLDLERVASLARLDDGVHRPTTSEDGSGMIAAGTRLINS